MTFCSSELLLVCFLVSQAGVSEIWVSGRNGAWEPAHALDRPCQSPVRGPIEECGWVRMPTTVPRELGHVHLTPVRTVLVGYWGTLLKLCPFSKHSLPRCLCASDRERLSTSQTGLRRVGSKVSKETHLEISLTPPPKMLHPPMEDNSQH